MPLPPRHDATGAARRRGPMAQVAALLLLLGACSVPDYTAVRDWARTAGIAADYPPAAQAADPLPAGIRAMQAALSTYLAGLATIASDGVLPYREDPFAERLAPMAAAADAAGGQAVATLGPFLRSLTIGNARAPQTREVIGTADPTVQALIAALSGAVARTAPGGEAADAAPRAAPARDPAARAALDELAALRQLAVVARAAARERYRDVLAAIAEGHALLAEEAGRITQEETIRRVRAAEDALRRAAFLLPALPDQGSDTAAR